MTDRLIVGRREFIKGVAYGTVGWLLASCDSVTASPTPRAIEISPVPAASFDVQADGRLLGSLVPPEAQFDRAEIALWDATFVPNEQSPAVQQKIQETLNRMNKSHNPAIRDAGMHISELTNKGLLKFEAGVAEPNQIMSANVGYFEGRLVYLIRVDPAEVEKVPLSTDALALAHENTHIRQLETMVAAGGYSSDKDFPKIEADILANQFAMESGAYAVGAQATQDFLRRGLRLGIDEVVIRTTAAHIKANGDINSPEWKQAVSAVTGLTAK